MLAYLIRSGGYGLELHVFFFPPHFFCTFFSFFFPFTFLNFRCVPSPCLREEFCWAVGELHGNTIEYWGGEWRIYGRLSWSITVQYGTRNSSYRTDRIPVVILNIGQGRHVRTIDRGREATWKLWEIEETFFFLSFFLQSDFDWRGEFWFGERFDQEGRKLSYEWSTGTKGRDWGWRIFGNSLGFVSQWFMVQYGVWWNRLGFGLWEFGGIVLLLVDSSYFSFVFMLWWSNSVRSYCEWVLNSFFSPIR